ncbi:dymeclin [Pseudoscourfieldia marina]
MGVASSSPGGGGNGNGNGASSSMSSRLEHEHARPQMAPSSAETLPVTVTGAANSDLAKDTSAWEHLPANSASATPTSTSDAAANALMARLCGANSVSLGEADAAYWTQLLSYAGDAAASMTSAEARILVHSHIARLVANNLETANLVKLVAVASDALLACLSSIQEDTPPPAPLLRRAVGALFITRHLVLGLIEHAASPEAVMGHLCDSPNAYASGERSALTCASTLDKYLRSLVAALGAQTPTDATTASAIRVLRYEGVMGLISASATQLYTPLHLSITEMDHGGGAYLAGSPITERLVAIREMRAPLIEALLTLYCDGALQPPAPSPSMWRRRRDDADTAIATHSLAMACASLLLILLQYTPPPPPSMLSPRQSQGPITPRTPRSARRAAASPFLSALTLCQDEASYPPSLPAETMERQAAGVPRISFERVYRACTTNLDTEQGTMLLYALSHHNPAFLDHVLSQSALDELVVPILALLYRGGVSTSSSSSTTTTSSSSSSSPSMATSTTPSALTTISTHHTYLLLIILLILSQDTSFQVNLHTTRILASTDLRWFADRSISPRNLRLGSLTVIVLCRIAKMHIAPPATRDLYLLTNALAVLTNLAPHFAHLDAYASQSIVGLFEAMAKRYRMLLARTQDDDESSPRDDGGAPDSSPASPKTAKRSAYLEIEVSEHYLRIVLELLNAVASESLERNPEMAYVMLYKSEVFETFAAASSEMARMEARMRGGSMAAEALGDGAGCENGGAHPQFRNLLGNLFAVIRFFTRRLEGDDNDGEMSTSASALLVKVEAACRSWQPNILSDVHQTSYQYEEEPPKAHAEYFVPYVWRLARNAVDQTKSYFDTDRIGLYAVDTVPKSF